MVGTLVSLCAALLGVSLVLKRYSMIGDGLSHVGFGVLTVATAFGATSPLYIAIPCVTISAIVLLKIGNNSKIKSDSAIYYRKLFIVTFDEDFAKASGLSAKRYTDIIAVLTALIIVIGMRMMGVMLISSIIIFPALTSMRIFKSFKCVVISSGVISVLSFLVGIYLSYLYNISTGAMIVIVNLVLFILFSIIEKIIHE